MSSTTYAGCSYPNERAAAVAFWLDFLTGDGNNSAEDAARFAAQGFRRNLYEAEAGGWRFPCEDRGVLSSAFDEASELLALEENRNET